MLAGWINLYNLLQKQCSTRFYFVFPFFFGSISDSDVINSLFYGFMTRGLDTIVYGRPQRPKVKVPLGRTWICLLHKQLFLNANSIRKDINRKIRKTKFIYICGSKNGSSSKDRWSLRRCEPRTKGMSCQEFWTKIQTQ